MRRGCAGRYDITTIGGETIHALVPYHLPPNPSLEISAQRQQLLERATLEEAERAPLRNEHVEVNFGLRTRSQGKPTCRFGSSNWRITPHPLETQVQEVPAQTG